MGVGAKARGMFTRAGEPRPLGWLAAAWLAGCVSTSIPEPAHGSPLSPQTEAAPETPVATSLTHDPLATLPPPAHHEHGHHHDYAASDAEHPAADGGEQAQGDVYVCPMHPDVRQSTPGTCPRCGMKLVLAPKPAPAPKPEPHAHHGE